MSKISKIKNELATTSDPTLRRCLLAELSVAISAASRAHRRAQTDQIMCAVSGNSKPWLAASDRA